MDLQLTVSVELRAAAAALKLFEVEMSIYMVAHIARRGEPLAAILATKRLFTRVCLEVVVQARLMAHNFEARLVWALVLLQTCSHYLIVDLLRL